MGLLALTVWTGAAACNSTARRQGPPEIERALTRIVPPAARSVSAPSYDAGTISMSASREFVTDLTWNEYVAFLDGALAPDWKNADDAGRNASTQHFTKSVTGDAYFLSVESLNASFPVHVRATVLGVPD